MHAELLLLRKQVRTLRVALIVLQSGLAKHREMDKMITEVLDETDQEI